ncbi:MAG: putative acetyltransferase [Nocardioides sp.]|nr:putative acetyltransferase [Nocardioides sp.]
MARSDLVTRPLTVDDFGESWGLGLEAFGDLPPGRPGPTPESSVATGRHPWGTFDDGRLVARVVGREYRSWFGGAEVSTCGVAGVTVVAERRGDGLLTDLVRALLVEARERGEVLSTLFPTAPGIYRRLGYELIGALDTVELPMAELAAVRAPAGVTTRRATAGDFDAVRRVYDTWAAAQNGPLTRRGPSFVASAEEFVGAFTGVTLAVDASGEVVGFASWQRGQGYDPATSTLEADDLLALGADAYRALWRVLGSFSAVTGRLRVSTSGADVARLVLPAGTWRVVDTHPYMLRLLDVAGAFSARSFDGSAEAVLAVTGDPLGLLDGSYRLRVSGGRTTCERVEATDAATFTPQGLALAYAGAQSCANLRMVGHLAGPTTYDATLDRLLGGRRVHIRDYF